MPRSNSVMIKKLQTAINTHFHEKLVINKTEFYSANQDRPIHVWSVRKTEPNEKTGKNEYRELFSSTSQLQIVLFMRDYWYMLNGWEIPTDNEKWEIAKQNYQEKNSV